MNGSPSSDVGEWVQQETASSFRAHVFEMRAHRGSSHGLKPYFDWIVNLNLNGVGPVADHDVAALSGVDFDGLGERLGHDALRKRLTIEEERTQRYRTIRSHPRTFSPKLWQNDILKFSLRALRLYDRGYHNFKDVAVRHNIVRMPSLPSAFDGYRLLHLSDLHIDLEDELADVLLGMIHDLSYDLCVLTGDYRAHTAGSSLASAHETGRVLEAIDTPIYATLGNHDFIDVVPILEAQGVRFLLNESVIVKRGNARLYLAGIDDANTYETHDLALATANIPPDHVSILLSHTPDVYVEAAAYDYDLLLSGHTHAGQICLPGGVAIERNIRGPRELLQGPWQYGRMAGYTSAGAGATGLPIRFNCRPEITVHELKRTV